MMAYKTPRQTSEDLVKFFPPSKLPHQNYSGEQRNAFLQQKGTYTIAYNYFRDQLNKINPNLFPYLTEAEKKTLKERLLSIFNLIQIQLHFDEIEKRHYNRQNYYKALDDCAAHLQNLSSDQTLVEQAHNTPESLDELRAVFAKKLAEPQNYLKFLGIIGKNGLVESLAKDLYKFNVGKSVAVKKWLTQINFRRLYWIWGDTLLASILALLPNDFFNKSQAQWELSTPTPIMGYLSFLLYYIRFSINFYLLLKHTFFPSEAERKNFELKDRLRAQWEQRKFLLLNDSIWATANLLGFVWLKGAGKLGLIGNLLTMGLLVMDLSLTIWRFEEAKSNHKNQLNKLKEAKANLESELASLEKAAKLPQTTDNPEIYTKISQLEAHLNDLKNAEKELHLAWKYRRYGLINDLIFATGLVIGFSIMCSFFLPPAMAVAAPAFMLGGAAVCFALTVTYTAVNSGIKIAKEKGYIKNLVEERRAFLKQYTNTSTLTEQKKLFLLLTQNQNELLLHQAKIEYKRLKLIRSVLVDAIIPAVVFTSFVFMPLGIGLAVLAASLILAALSHIFIKQFKPQASKLPAFEETHFNKFDAKNDPCLKRFASSTANKLSSMRLFSPKSRGYQPIAVESEAPNNPILLNTQAQ